MGLLLRCAALSVLIGVPMAHSRAQGTTGAPVAPTTVLIFDGSGSMWGKLDGEKQIKLAEARDAVRTALGKMSPQAVQLGLMSFGHRRQGDCADVQMIAAPESVPAPAFTDRIMAPLDKLNPKGKGPLTAALREAAKALGKLSGPRQIVMIHDDPDNCQQDACAALPELQQSAPGVVIHVIGLGLKPEDATRYQCLTKPTGGQHTDAQDGASLATGIGDALQLASLTGPEAGIAKPKAADGPVTQAAGLVVAGQPVVLLTDGAPALRLRAMLVADRLAVGQGIQWSITAQSAPVGQGPLIEVEGADVIVPIAAGTYRVRARGGLVAGERTVTVAAQGHTLGEIVLDATELRIKSLLPGDATVIISEREPALAAAKPATPVVVGRRLGLWPHGQTTLLVPARPLWLQLEQGDLRADRPIAAIAGQAVDVDVGQPGARVRIDLLPTAGPAIVGATFNQPVVLTIEEDDPDQPRGRREIARSASTSAEFVVAPGSYLIGATRGVMETRVRISVAAGDQLQRSLALVAARLVVGARLTAADGRSLGDGAADNFRIARLEPDGETVLLVRGPAAIADLPPGRYRVEARRSNASTKADITAAQVIDLAAGEYRAITIEYQAGELRMAAPAGADATGDGVTWRVMDAAGALVWSGDQAQTSTILGAGTYTVRAVFGGLRREQTVEVRAGAVSTVRVAP